MTEQAPQFAQMQAKRAAEIRPCINVAGVVDILTGAPILATHGRYIVNGGHSGNVVFAGPNNSYKSLLANHWNFTAAHRSHRWATGQIYDTENTVTSSSLEQRLYRILGNSYVDWFDTGRWLIVGSVDYSLDEWFEMYKDFALQRSNAKMDQRVIFPGLDKDGKNSVKPVIPAFLCFDSLTQSRTDNEENMVQKHEVGDGKQNMLYMSAGKSKAVVFQWFSRWLPKSDSYATHTAHLDKEFKLDPYAPSTKQSQYAKNGLIVKGIPGSVLFLSTQLWVAEYVTNLVSNADKKVQMYPEKGTVESTEDLNIAMLRIWRSKTGPSGALVSFIVSQADGFLEGLTDFHYLRTNGMFGLNGTIGKTTDRFDEVTSVFMPEVKLTRTTVRGLLSSNHRLARAINISAQMHAMQSAWVPRLRAIDPRLCTITPQEVYDKIKAAGYDWDTILDTRYWYSYDDAIHPQLELSTLDIMRMALGLYHPYWMENDKKTIKPKYRAMIEQASNKIAENNQVVEDLIEDTI